MKKIELLEIINEKMSILDPTQGEKTAQNLINVNKSMVDLTKNVKGLKDMGVMEENEDDDYETTTQYFISAIDRMLEEKFNLTFFTSKPPTICLSSYRDSKIISYIKEKYNSELKKLVLIEIVELLISAKQKLKFDDIGEFTADHPLKEPYMILKDYVRSNVNENNFVKSKLFTIIAEAERPTISKADLLKHLKTTLSL